MTVWCEALGTMYRKVRVLLTQGLVNALMGNKNELTYKPRYPYVAKNNDTPCQTAILSVDDTSSLSSCHSKYSRGRVSP